MLKFLYRGAIACGIIGGLLLFYILGYGGALRKTSVIKARVLLKNAQHAVAEKERIDPVNPLFRGVITFTNRVIVDGTNYQCEFLVPLPRFEDEGSLAMTTNNVLIFFPKVGEPKIIPDKDYSPRFFPEGF